MTKKELNDWKARTEMCLMGFSQKVYSREQAEYMTGYIQRVLKNNSDDSIPPKKIAEEGKPIIDAALKYSPDHKVFLINISTLEDMALLFLGIIPQEEKEDEVNVTDEDGVFGYCYNFQCPDFSELGYSYFELNQGRLLRVG